MNAGPPSNKPRERGCRWASPLQRAYCGASPGIHAGASTWPEVTVRFFDVRTGKLVRPGLRLAWTALVVPGWWLGLRLALAAAPATDVPLYQALTGAVAALLAVLLAQLR